MPKFDASTSYFIMSIFKSFPSGAYISGIKRWASDKNLNHQLKILESCYSRCEQKYYPSLKMRNPLQMGFRYFF